MTVLAICLLVLGAGLTSVGALRLAASRRRALSPGEVPPAGWLPFMVAGDLALIAGVLILVL